MESWTGNPKLEYLICIGKYLELQVMVTYPEKGKVGKVMNDPST